MPVSKQNTVAPSVPAIEEPKVQDKPTMSVSLSKEKKGVVVLEIPVHKPTVSSTGKTHTVFHGKLKSSLTMNGQPIYWTVTGFIYPK